MNVIEARPGVYMSNGVAIGPSIGVQLAGRAGALSVPIPETDTFDEFRKLVA